MPLLRSRLLPKLPWKALHFDGVDDYVTVPHSDVFNMKSFCVEIMFRPISFTNPNTGYKAHWLFKDQYIAVITSSEGLVEVRTVDSSSNLVVLGSSRAIELDRYHVIAYNVHEEGVVELFIDGELDSSKEFSGPPQPNERNIVVGSAYDLSYACRGLIALVRIYNRVLTEDEIKWNYYHPDDPIRSGLVLWLHYDSIDEENGVWRDKTPNGNDGDIYGATVVEFTKPPYRTLSPSRTLSPVR